MKTQMKKIESTSLTDRLLWIARECLELSNNRLPQIVTDERLTELVLAMQDCCSDSSEEKIDLIPDFRVLENHYVAWLDALKPIAAKALWLKPETKKRVEEFIESLPPFFMRGKYKITYDCFSSRIFQLKKTLAHFAGKQNLRFLEIGSFEGYSACWLLDNILTHESSRLVCIDIFKDPRAESLFDRNVALTGASHRLTKQVGFSDDELIKFGKDEFDFIYVDGSHQQVAVLQDAVLAWRVLKTGGIMVLDDYELPADPLAKFLYSKDQPDVGIDAFLHVFQSKYRLLHKGYQVVVQKI